MVFLSVANFVRSRGPDQFWKRRRILRLSALMKGRRWNCYSIAVRAVHRSLQNATKARKLKKKDLSDLWNARICAATDEHGVPFNVFRESLARANILLNRKVLADIAAWEPQTFKSLTHIAWDHANEEGLNGIQSMTDPPDGVITRNLLKFKVKH